jgi:hypothetical protein
MPGEFKNGKKYGKCAYWNSREYSNRGSYTITKSEQKKHIKNNCKKVVIPIEFSCNFLYYMG